MKRLMKTPQTTRQTAVVLATLAVLASALGFGIAQSTVVTESEWVVYMAQGLALDWNLPDSPKSQDYLERLDWKQDIDFSAGELVDGSTAALDGGLVMGTGDGSPAEALYRFATLRRGDYGLRIKMGGGGALLKVAEREYELYQPEASPRWLDLDRAPLDPGEHSLSVMLDDGARLEGLGIVPPCMAPVAPSAGWRLLDPLHFGTMAETIAKALELESDLPAIGDAERIAGEDFRRTIVYPLDGEPSMSETGAGETDEPFWLTAGNNIVNAVATFTVEEKGVYSIEAHYLSPRPLRWNVDSCFRVVTCPVAPTGASRRRSLALELDVGEHTVEVTLPPHAKLDRIEIQRRDADPEQYVEVVSDAGFSLGDVEEPVRRVDAVRAARRLADRFDRFLGLQCTDELIALEATARALAASSSASSDGTVPGAGVGMSGAGGASSPQLQVGSPIVPPEVSSPTEPQ